MNRRRWPSGLARWAVAGGLSLAPALPAGAQTPLPAGSEFQVNSYTTSFQYAPSVATTAAGGFVVVWHSYGSSGTDSSYASIQGQHHASDGSAQGAQFQVNTYTTYSQNFPAVATDAGGNFVVVWGNYGLIGTNGTFSVRGQRYASDGSTRGAEFQVNTYTTSARGFPSVAVAADGDFVVVWQSYGSSGTDTSGPSIQGQRYASDGSTQDGEFQVNSYTTGYQRNSSVAAHADGDFVVTWDSTPSTGPILIGLSVQAQRYASDGSTQGAQFQVNNSTTLDQFHPSVAADADGDFIVVWSGYGSSGTDSSLTSIQGKRYVSNGATQGAQFQINTYTTSGQGHPSVATDGDSNFVVVWASYGSSGSDTNSTSIHGQHFASNGSMQGAQFQVNTYTTSFQYLASVATDGDGAFVVAWHSAGSSGTDTSPTSIQAQRFGPGSPAVPALSNATRFALGAALMLLGIGYALRRRASLQ